MTNKDSHTNGRSARTDKQIESQWSEKESKPEARVTEGKTVKDLKNVGESVSLRKTCYWRRDKQTDRQTHTWRQSDQDQDSLNLEMMFQCLKCNFVRAPNNGKQSKEQPC